MILSAVLFALFSILAYICISIFAQMTGGTSTTLMQAALLSLRPIPILILILGNVFFAMAVFSGFGWTRFSVPAAIAVGVVTAFVYSALFLGGTVTVTKVLGILLILLGIYLLR